MRRRGLGRRAAKAGDEARGRPKQVEVCIQLLQQQEGKQESERKQCSSTLASSFYTRPPRSARSSVRMRHVCCLTQLVQLGSSCKLIN